MTFATFLVICATLLVVGNALEERRPDQGNFFRKLTDNERNEAPTDPNDEVQFVQISEDDGKG